jgi:hypothetical protein
MTVLLNLVVGSEVSPSGPGGGGVPAQIWRDPGGTVCAWAEGDAEAFTMTWPGLGAFRIERARSDIVAVPITGTSRDTIADIFARGVAPVALLHRGYEVLHASAVELNDGVVGFCARSGVGKSTLAHALSIRGHRHWSDDALTVEIGATVRAVRLPCIPRVGTGQRRVDSSVTPWPPSTIGIIAEAPLVSLYILERTADHLGAPADIERLSAATAFTAVLPQAHEVDLGGPARHRQLIARYLDLVALTPVYRVRFRPDMDRLTALAEMFESHARAERAALHG